jgi:hypothetical protein
MRNSAINPIPLQFVDLKAMGIDMPSTVTTEITGGPLPIFHNQAHDTEGASPKARKLLGWFRRASYEEPRRRSGIEDEEVGVPRSPVRANHSLETTTTGITVSYDIRRTVEEMRRESSSQGSPPGKDDIV